MDYIFTNRGISGISKEKEYQNVDMVSSIGARFHRGANRLVEDPLSGVHSSNSNLLRNVVIREETLGLDISGAAILLKEVK